MTVLTRAERPAHGLTAVPVQRREVLVARDDLLLLAADLRRFRHPDPAGVAGAALLVTGGAGPVFGPGPPGGLRRVVRRIADSMGAE